MAEGTRGQSKTYDVIADAATLMLRCVGMEFDRLQSKSGWKIFYAIDVDVITLYLNPESKQAYAAVFRGEEEDTKVLLARLLGDYILREYESSADVPGAKKGALFIVGPHLDELAYRLQTLSNKVLEHENVAFHKLDDLLRDESSRLRHASGSDALAKRLIDDAPAIIEAFDTRSGPAFEVSRFAAVGESRLKRLEQYTEQQGSWRFPLPNLEDRVDFEPFTQNVDEWKSRLLKHKTSGQPLQNVTRDAFVMATIEWVNRKIVGEKRRLVLVTGTKGILDASAEYAIRGGGDYPRTFADSFVRHPQSFMAERSFFARTQMSPHDEMVPVQNFRSAEEAFRLIDWLNLLFPGVLKEEPGIGPIVDTARMSRIEAAAKTKGFDADVLRVVERVDFLNSVHRTWETQVRAASVARRIDPPTAWSRRATEFLEWLRPQVTEDIDPAEIRNALAKRTLNSVEALYSSTVWLGLWSRVGTRPENVKGIPALRFEPEYEMAQDYCRVVLDVMRAQQGKKSKTSAIPLFDVSKMYTDLSQMEDSHYHAHIIHALAYATKGHWFATRTLCRVALRTLDLLTPEKRGKRRGREAAYLLAIAERRLARKLADIDNAEQYLDEARRRENPDALPDSRFLSEGLAEMVARISFRVFVLNDINAIAGVLEKVLPDALDLLERAAADPLPEARWWVRQQVLMNVLSLALMTVAFQPELATPHRAEIRRFVEMAEVHKNEQESNHSNWDNVAEFIQSVAMVVFGADEDAKQRARTSLKTVQFPVSLPFDRDRENTFRALCKKA